MTEIVDVYNSFDELKEIAKSNAKNDIQELLQTLPLIEDNANNINQILEDINCAKIIEDYKGVVQLYFDLGRIHLFHDLERSINYFRISYVTALKNRFFDEAVKSVLILAKVCTIAENFDDSILYYTEYLNINSKSLNEIEKQIIWFKLSEANFIVGNYSEYDRWIKMANMDQLLEGLEEARNSSNEVSSSSDSNRIENSKREKCPETIEQLLNYSAFRKLQMEFQKSREPSPSTGQSKKRKLSVEYIQTIPSTSTTEEITILEQAENGVVGSENDEQQNNPLPQTEQSEMIDLIKSGLELQYSQQYFVSRKKFEKILGIPEKLDCPETKKLVLFFLQDVYRKLIASQKGKTQHLDVAILNESLTSTCRKRVLLDVKEDASKTEAEKEDQIDRLLYQYEHEGRHEDALSVCNFVLAQIHSPFNALALYMAHMILGEAHFSLKNYDGALESYRVAFEIALEYKYKDIEDIMFKLYEICHHLSAKKTMIIIEHMEKYLITLKFKSTKRLNAIQVIIDLCRICQLYHLCRKYNKHLNDCLQKEKLKEKPDSLASNKFLLLKNRLQTEENPRPEVSEVVNEQNQDFDLPSTQIVDLVSSSNVQEQQSSNGLDFDDDLLNVDDDLNFDDELNFSDDTINSFIGPESLSKINPIGFSIMEQYQNSIVSPIGIAGCSDISNPIASCSRDMEVDLVESRNNVHVDDRNDITDFLPEMNQIKEQENNLDWKIEAQRLKSDAELFLSPGNYNYQLAIMKFDNYYNIHAENNDLLGKRDACELIMEKMIEANLYEDAMRYASKWYIQCMKLVDFARATRACEKINFIRSNLHLSELTGDSIFKMHFIPSTD